MMMRYEGRVVWVTGAGSGLGRAVSVRLASEGATIAASDLNVEAAAETVALVEEAGSRGLALQGDVRSLDDCAGAVAAGEAEFGRLDVVVANAGIVKFGMTEFVAESDWNDVLDIDLHGVFRTAKAAMPALKRAGGGALVFVSSVEGLVGNMMLPAYCSAKAGLMGLCRSMAQEGAAVNVRVNCVNPGFTATAMTAPMDALPGFTDAMLAKVPMGRVREADDIAAVVAFLGSDDARFVTGQAIAIDGGYTAVV